MSTILFILLMYYLFSLYFTVGVVEASKEDSFWRLCGQLIVIFIACWCIMPVQLGMLVHKLLKDTTK